MVRCLGLRTGTALNRIRWSSSGGVWRGIATHSDSNLRGQFHMNNCQNPSRSCQAPRLPRIAVTETVPNSSELRGAHINYNPHRKPTKINRISEVLVVHPRCVAMPHAGCQNEGGFATEAKLGELVSTSSFKALHAQLQPDSCSLFSYASQATAQLIKAESSINC